MLVEGFLSRFPVIGGQRVEGHRVVRLLVQHLAVEFVGLLLLAVLQVGVAQHHLVARVHGIFLHQALYLAEGAFVVLLLQVDAEFLHCQLFALARPLLQFVEQGQHLVIVLGAVVEVQQVVQRVHLVGESHGHLLQQGGGFLRLALFLVEVGQSLGIPEVVRVVGHGLLQCPQGLFLLLQEHVILRQLVVGRRGVRGNLQAMPQEVEGGVILSQRLLSHGLQEVVVVFALLLLVRLGEGGVRPRQEDGGQQQEDFSHGVHIKVG